MNVRATIRAVCMRAPTGGMMMATRVVGTAVGEGPIVGAIDSLIELNLV